MDKTGDVRSHICAVRSSLSPPENAIATYVLDHPSRTRRRNRYVTGVCFEIRKDA